jgi:hypothetical protein
MSEVGTTNDPTMACPICLPGEICDGMGCVSTAPYVPCSEGCNCVSGPNGESVCVPPCDPQGAPCPPTPIPLPVPACYDPRNGDPPMCVMECGFDPGSCGPSMICAPIGAMNLSVCMWP